MNRKYSFSTQYTLSNIFKYSVSQFIIIYVAISMSEILIDGFVFSWKKIAFALVAGIIYGLGTIRYNRYIKAHPEKYDLSKIMPKYSHKSYVEHQEDKKN